MVKTLSFSGIGLITTLALSTGVFQPLAAKESELDRAYYQLQLAVCQNQWPEAIAMVGPIIATPTITESYRQTMVDFRYQLQTWQQAEADLSTHPSCTALMAHTLPTDDGWSTQPLNWSGAIESATGAEGYSDYGSGYGYGAYGLAQNDVEGADGLPYLTPATLINTDTGSGIVAGEVSTSEMIYAFRGVMDDVVSIELDVTRVFPGSTYTDDDSQLFLFNSRGVLLAENDDAIGLQSRISEVTLPESGTYYVVVTTYNNDPILDSTDTLTGWGSNGGSHIEYTLTVTGVTPAYSFRRN